MAKKSSKAAVAEATTTKEKKPRKPRPTFDERYEKWLGLGVFNETLQAWLVKNDKPLWGARTKMKDGQKQFERASKLSMVTFEFKCHVLRFCEFWQNPNHRGASSPTGTNLLSSEAWEKLQVFLKRTYASKQPCDLDAEDVTLDFIVRLCRFNGAPASRDILKKCSVFKALSNRRFG